MNDSEQRMLAAMKGMTCIEDLRKAGRKRVPKAFRDYVEAGSYAEETLRANRADLERIKIRQKVLVDISNPTTTTRILGDEVSVPIALSTIGITGLQHANGEIHACRAAQAMNISYTLSTLSICSIEDVAAAVEKPFWFQLYVMKDRGFVRELIQRAAAAKCSALVLTVDLQVLGQRHADIRNGLSVPPELKLKTLLGMAAKPRWLAGMLRSKRWTFGNLAGHVKDADNPRSLPIWIAHQFDPTLTWADIDWIRSIWPGKLILKGILDLDDAKLAAKSGATAIVVSNHGGRQQDGAPSTISMLPRIAKAVGSDVEILFDGGIRSGQDVLRALALGARGCLIGRAYIYGLQAGGQAGVMRAIEILGNELKVAMGLAGVRSIAAIDEMVLVKD